MERLERMEAARKVDTERVMARKCEVEKRFREGGDRGGDVL